MKKAVQYSMITIIISAIYAMLYYNVLKIQSGIPLAIAKVTYMWIPAIIAIIMTKQEGKKIRDLGIKFRLNRWFIFAIIIFIPVTLLSIPVNLFFPNISFSAEMSGFLQRFENLMSPDEFQALKTQMSNNPFITFIIMTIQALLAGATINTLAAFGEELGWRGYLHKALEGMEFWKMSLFIGTIWGIWHAPVILQGHNYPSYPVLGVFMMILFCILTTPLFTLIRIKTESVIAASMAHGVLNAIGGASIMYIVGGSELINGFMGLSGFIILLVINIIIYGYYKKTSINQQISS